MKSKELRKLNHEDLLKIKKELELNLMRASSLSGREKIKNKDVGIKGATKSGSKTSFKKNIRRSIAKILTIIREREIENANQPNKHN